MPYILLLFKRKAGKKTSVIYMTRKASIIIESQTQRMETEEPPNMGSIVRHQKCYCEKNVPNKSDELKTMKKITRTHTQKLFLCPWKSQQYIIHYTLPPSSSSQLLALIRSSRVCECNNYMGKQNIYLIKFTANPLLLFTLCLQTEEKTFFFYVESYREQ